MHCPNCDEIIDNNLEICPYCGEKVSEVKLKSDDEYKEIDVEDFVARVENERREEKEYAQGPLWAALWAILSVLVLGVFTFGYLLYAKYSAPVESFGQLTLHPEFEDVESGPDAKVAIKKINDGEISLEQYLKEKHPQKNKNTLFGIFYDNINFYTEIITYKFNEQVQEKCIPLEIIEQPGLQKYSCAGINLGIETKIEYETDYEGNPYHYPVINKTTIISPQIPSVKAVADGENGFVYLPNFEYMETEYAKYLTPDWQDYLRIKAIQEIDLENKPMFSDGYLTIELKQLADWIITLQDFNKKYPKFELNKNITKDIHSYTSTLILTEYRVFDPTTDKLLVKARQAYEYFLEKADTKSEEYQAVKECYEALKLNDFKYNSEYRESFDKWNKKWHIN